MFKRFLSCGLVMTGLLSAASAVYADEGMFLFSDPPQQQLQSRYGFSLSQDWLNRASQSAVRFNNGGSGGFISEDGLVITNHHVASEALSTLSTPEHDLYAEGFLAKNRSAELRVPNLELNCLQSIEDVTTRVQMSVNDKMSQKAASLIRQSTIAKIESESMAKTGLRSEVVTLYQGGVFHLYRYKKYTDVRLVWAPEQQAASFGGDVDNFEYPREAVDVAFFRVYENNIPVRPQAYLRVNPQGAQDNELVFVAGHPGSTNRQDTVKDMLHYRDNVLPFMLNRVRTMEAAMAQYSARGAEEKRQATDFLSGYANSRKVYVDVFAGLLDKDVLKTCLEQEQRLQSKANSVEPWLRVGSVYEDFAPYEKQYWLLESGYGFSSRLFGMARSLVRLGQEMPKPSDKRLREYSDSNLESLKYDLFSQEPLYPELEIARLSASLAFMAEELGGNDDDVQLVLQGKSPSVRARELVQGCTLADLAKRQELEKGGLDAVKASNDALIKLALEIDARSRQLRERYETEVAEPLLTAYQQIAKERFQQEGTSVPPDATFTLRLAFGVVKGYQENHQELPYCTHIGDYYKVYDKHEGLEPYNLPESWLKARQNVDWNKQLVFLSTADITGGNSGSPVVGRDGRMVGVAFDGNRYSNINKFLYAETQARCLSVSTQAIIESLRSVYGGEALLEELGVK